MKPLNILTSYLRLLISNLTYCNLTNEFIALQKLIYKGIELTLITA